MKPRLAEALSFPNITGRSFTELDSVTKSLIKSKVCLQSPVGIRLSTTRVTFVAQPNMAYPVIEPKMATSKMRRLKNTSSEFRKNIICLYTFHINHLHNQQTVQLLIAIYHTKPEYDQFAWDLSFTKILQHDV